MAGRRPLVCVVERELRGLLPFSVFFWCAIGKLKQDRQRLGIGRWVRGMDLLKSFARICVNGPNVAIFPLGTGIWGRVLAP